MLGALIFTTLILVTFRPSLSWAIGISVISMPSFAYAFFWLWVQRTAELRMKLGSSKEEAGPHLVRPRRMLNGRLNKFKIATP